MMNEEIFLSSKNIVSNRWAIFEDDGISGWLYLTEPNQQKPIADCWIYNRIDAPNPSEIIKFKNGPSPVSTEFAGPNALVLSPKENEFNFKWSEKGNAVALYFRGEPLGYIEAGAKGGFSKNLQCSCSWGNIFEKEMFKILFSE